MTAKEYLSRIQTYRKAIESTRERIEEMYTEAAGLKAIVYDKDRVQVSQSNKMEELMIRIDTEAQKMSRQILKYQTEVQKRIEQIAGMERADYAEILRLRYIEPNPDGNAKSLEQIAYLMHRSYDNTKHLHGWALDAFQKKYLS